jgi:hypothetical protein
MNDRELLELAAKAAGYRMDVDGLFYEPGEPTMQNWNPIEDDGDALRLAVKLGMQMYIWQPNDGLGVHYTEINRTTKEPHACDSQAATRRAIVRAAAEIGRGMK